MKQTQGGCTVASQAVSDESGHLLQAWQATTNKMRLLIMQSTAGQLKAIILSVVVAISKIIQSRKPNLFSDTDF